MAEICSNVTMFTKGYLKQWTHTYTVEFTMLVYIQISKLIQ